MPNDEQAIRDLLTAWQDATAAGDLSKVLSLMAEDAVFLTPGHPPMLGRDAFATAFKGVASTCQHQCKVGNSRDQDCRRVRMDVESPHGRGDSAAGRFAGTSIGIHAYHPAKASRRSLGARS